MPESKVTCAWDTAQNRAKAEVETPEPGLLIGKNGKTLESLQFLVTVIVGRRTGVSTAIQVECEGYWKKVEEKILEDVGRAVEDVKRTGRPFRLEPMEPALRRLVHRKLQDDPDVETASEGEGPWRKVVIRPKAKHSAV
jgi:spoIIIJ-associated protein